MNKTKHNSNSKLQQITLNGEIIQEYTYYLLGFVSADVVRLKKNWFIINDVEKIQNFSNSYESTKLN